MATNGFGDSFTSDIEVLRQLVLQRTTKDDLQWSREVCITTRKLVHEFAIAPVNRELMLEVNDLIQQAMAVIAKAAKDSSEIAARLRNITERQRALDQLLAGRTLVPLSI